MAKKQWGTTYDEDILKEFQVTCEEYGMKANVVLEALMKFFTEGNCSRKRWFKYRSERKK